MDYQELPASPPFDELVTCVWFLTGRAEPNVPQPVVPDGRLELLLHLGDPFSRLDGNGKADRQSDILVAGQLTGPIYVMPGPWIEVVGVRLTPPGAYALFASPLNELTNEVLSLTDLRPLLASRLERAARASGTRASRARMILAALGRSLVAEPDRGMAGVESALAGGFPGSMKRLAAEAGMTPRSLERRFRAEVGLSPKVYQRVVRFRRAFRWLSETGRGGWTEVALRAGYYDQAHMIRDFAAFAGMAPGRFFGADPDLARAFSQANPE